MNEKSQTETTTDITKLISFTEKEIRPISKDEKLKTQIIKEFNELSRTRAQYLISKILKRKDDESKELKLSDLDMTKNQINKNTKHLDIKDNKPFLKIESYNRLYEIIITYVISRSGSCIKELEPEDKALFKAKNVNGKREVGDGVTYKKLIVDIEKNLGKVGDYLYNFSNKKIKPFDSTDDELQTINVDIITNAETSKLPLEYVYECPKCKYLDKDYIHTRYPSDMNSIVGNKINCNMLIETEKGTKMCGTTLEPSVTDTKYRELYVYDSTIEKEYEDKTVKEDCRIVSFKHVPVGPLIGAVINVPNSDSKKTLFLIDYKIEEKKVFELEFDESKHNIFNLIKNVDNHIFNVEGYKHFGYLPMKIAALIQYSAAVFSNVPKNYHIALNGGPSTGKTAFSKYWGAALHGRSMLEVANVTDISIPALRGTAEYDDVLGKRILRRNKGFLNTNDLIIINELSSDLNMKRELKGHLFSEDYSYSKARSNGIKHQRNAQFIITENVNPEHDNKYINSVRKFYKDNTDRIIDNKGNEVEPLAWDDTWDLHLPLHHDFYKNKLHLLHAIKTVRYRFNKSNINWIDGDEIASDDRFSFYFFISGDKDSKEKDEVIFENLENVTKNPLTSRLIRDLHTDTFKNYIKGCESFFNKTHKDDRVYMNKLNNLISQYTKSTDRLKIIFYNMMKILRSIDKRDYFIEEDFNIIKYILENTKSKIELADTNKFEVHDVEETNYTVEQSVSMFDEFIE